MAADDRATVTALEASRAIFRQQVDCHDGRVVDTAGDSILAVFDTAIGATNAALEIQRRLLGPMELVPSEERMLFRIGIHLGDVIEKRDGSVYGDGVNIAARLQALGDPGSITVSQSVEDAVRDRVPAGFFSLGDHQVKNISRPVRVFRCEPAAPASAPARPHAGRQEAARDRSATAPWRYRSAAILSVAVVLCGLLAASWLFKGSFMSPPAVEPYSAQDRRMTFAVLPFVAPENDAVGGQIAKAYGDAVQADMDLNSIWAHVVPRSIVDQALIEQRETRNAGSILDVHFLMRGSVVKSGPLYSVVVTVVDVETGRVLESRSIPVPQGSTSPRGRSEIRSVCGALVYAGSTPRFAAVGRSPMKNSMCAI